MDLNAARKRINRYLIEQFGKAVSLREVSVERSTSGRVFAGEVFCVTQNHEIPLGSIGISENGEIVREISIDNIVDTIMSFAMTLSQKTKSLEADHDFSLITENDDLSLFPSGNNKEENEELDRFFSEHSNLDVMQRIIGLLSSGAHSDLMNARRLMPRMLVDHEQRGEVLLHMGELEIRLEAPQLGLNYLEAAACEFADRGDVEGLERSVALASRALSEPELKEHLTTTLLEKTMERVTPIDSIEDCPIFSNLSNEQLNAVREASKEIVLDEGETILKEGTPATTAFVIISGILGIDLETPGGESRTVRCCFPGDLVGESCVQGPGATCNATVFTKQKTSLWRFSGEALKALIQEIPLLEERIEESRTLHQLDSFFSMNALTNTLDVRIRDRLLGCITAIRNVIPNEVIETEQSAPKGVYLVARGRLKKELPDGSTRIYDADAFACLRETLHKLPLEGNLVAESRGRLVVFDTDALFELAMNAPPEVSAVLNRLE